MTTQEDHEDPFRDVMVKKYGEEEVERMEAEAAKKAQEEEVKRMVVEALKAERQQAEVKVTEDAQRMLIKVEIGKAGFDLTIRQAREFALGIRQAANRLERLQYRSK